MGDIAPRDIVFTKVFLSDLAWTLLMEWVSRPTGHTKRGNSGGMQRRRLDWALRMNEKERSILLTTHSSPVRKTTDDLSWIARTIINQHAGGFQSRIAKIFTGTHPAFTNLAIKPRRVRNRHPRWFRTFLALAVGVTVSLSGPRPAEARRSCGHDRIYRVSMGICVGARSRLGRGYAGARRTIRYGHHHYRKFAMLSSWQEEDEGRLYERERRSRVKPPPVLMRHSVPRLAPQDLEAQVPPATEEIADVPYVIDMPFGIWGSRMMRPPSQPYWRLP